MPKLTLSFSQSSTLCSLLMGWMGLNSAFSAEGIITSGAMTGDADSGVNAAKTYVALGNIIGGNVTVNSVTFLGTGLSGTGWALSGAGNTFGGGGNHTSTFGGSTIDDLFDGFQYGGNPGTLTLSGLTAGQTYVATLYNEAWGLGDNRTQTITAGDGSSLVYNEDALEASVVRYTFVATGTSTTLDFLPTIPGNTMHFYGMSTEQVFNNTWTAASGNSWNTALNWASTPVNNSIPNSVGANASFAAQGVPTTVTLDSATTIGHVQFLGSGNYTVSGGNTLTVQADAGGVSVLKADAGVHTLATPIQLNSALSKFGAGTIKLGGALTGTAKGVNLATGSLVIESSTADISSLGNVSNSGTFTISSAVPQTFASAISGAGTFEKAGSDLLTLKGNQTYTGPTIISGGTLKLGSSVALTIGNSSFETHDPLANGSYGYVPTGATWTFASGSGINLNGGPFFNPTNHDGIAGGFVQGSGGGISQSVTVTDAGNYTFTFQGVSRAGGGPNGLLLTVDGNVVRSISPAELSQSSWTDFTVQVPLTSGAHTIAFVGNNTLGGDRTSVIDKVAGEIASGRLPSTTALNLTASGATLDLSGFSQVVGSLAGVAGSSVINDGTFTVGGDNTATLFSGGISGTGSFVKNGTGILSLGGANSYAGVTTHNAGTIQLTGGALPSSTALQLASGATFDINGGAQTLAAISGAAGSAVTLGSGNLTVGNASVSSHAGSLSGTGSLTKVGTGPLNLSGPTSYSGGTTISAGLVRSLTTNTSNVGAMAVATGAAWDLTTESHTVSGLTGGGSITRQGLLSTGADGSSLISTSKNYLLKLDFGNNGGATVNGVTFNTAGTTGTGFNLTGAGAEFGGGDIGGYDQLVGDFYYNGNPATLTFSGLTPGQTYETVLYTKVGHWTGRPQNATFDDDGAGPNSQVLLNTDPGSVGYYAYRFVAPSTTMSVNMDVTGPGTFHWFGASLESVATAPQTLTIGSADNYSFTGVISGPTTLIKQGSGTQQLSGASTFTGGTTITGGIIMAHDALALGTGAVSIASGANYLPWWNAATPATVTSTIANNFTLNGLGGDSPGGSKAAIYADGGGAALAEYTLTGNIMLAATSNLGGNTNNNLRVSGPISGPGGLTKGGGRSDENNTLILGNTGNSYAGDTLVTKGTVKLGASEVIPNGAGKGGLNLSANTTLDLGGFSETVNRLSGSGNIVSTASVGTPVYFNDDAGTGISTSKTYTHKLDFTEGTPVTINGVAFIGADAGGGANNWTLVGPGGAAGSDSTGATGDISRLLTNFYYNGNPATLTLTGLVPNQTYEAHLYERAWGGNRTQLFTVDAGSGTGTTIFNEDASATPSYIPFRYTANSSGQVVITTNQLGDGSYHWFGASNEVVAGPTLTFGDATDQTFGGAISGPTALTKQGSGKQTFTGTNTYTGATNLTGGTLLLGAAGALSSASNVSLSGATLATGGYTNAGAVLSQLPGTNVIDFASGNGQLTFANTGTWTGMFSIWNYDGAPWMAGIDKLNFTANGLSSLDLSNIHFYTGAGTGLIDNGEGATFLPSGELVPVPEPAAFFSATGLVLLVLGRESRRRRTVR